MSGAAENKAVVRRVYEDGYNGGDESVFAELYHSSFVHHSKALHDVGQGPEAERKSMLRFREALPDVRFEILDLLAEGDQVVARLRITGTPRADFGDVLASDGRFDRHAVALLRLRDGHLVEEWFFTDAGTSTS
jgi:predicted ester cyclase